ncbi:DEAD/DEAH box helicase [Planctomycetota bacterium]
MQYNDLKLDPFQEQAIQAIQLGKSVLVSAPTGAGKTLIAEYAIEQCLANNQRIIYTAPIKALSNQKFRNFRQNYGERIGIMTGDVVINQDAPAMIMTTEIFRNISFDAPQRLKNISYVIFDEVHFLSDEDRGTVWEESIIFAPKHIKFIALSATIRNLNQLAAWIKKVHQDDLVVIEEPNRPVPLKHSLFIRNHGPGNINDLKRIENQKSIDRRDFFRHKHRSRQSLIAKNNWKNLLIDHLASQHQLPCLYFIFNREGCRERAEDNLTRNFLTPSEQLEAIKIFQKLCDKYQLDKSETSIQSLEQLVKHGIAYHHAGMLPTLKEIVEQLFTTGLIKILFATETFALGINMPAKTVVFDCLVKYDGVGRAPMKVLEYHQMAGRAGRRGIDKQGFVYSNIELPYDRFKTINQIMSDDIEPIQSQFNLSYASILSLYERVGERIYQACAQSFSNFQSIRAKRKTTKRQSGPDYAQVVNQLERKLRLLQRTNYLRGKILTPKGQLARRLFGYELHLAELYTRGIITPLDPDQLNILLVAIVFESKKHDYYKKFNPKTLIPFYEEATEIIYKIRKAEKNMGIVEPIKPLDNQLSAAAAAWSQGESFSNLKDYTSAADGDLIRTFRLTIQLHRELLNTLGDKSPGLRTKIIEALRKFCRDEVDAERQLRLT